MKRFNGNFGQLVFATVLLTNNPTITPSASPTSSPTDFATVPTDAPSTVPTMNPTIYPTMGPTIYTALTQEDVNLWFNWVLYFIIKLVTDYN